MADTADFSADEARSDVLLLSDRAICYGYKFSLTLWTLF